MRSLIVLALVAACSKTATDAGPTCSVVVDNMMAVTKAQMSGHGGMEVQNRKAMIDQCEARKMPADQRSCLATAKDLGAIATCMKAHPPTKP